MSSYLRQHWVRLAVLALLLVGLGLRLYNLNWDDNHHVHPDERWITMVAMDTYVPEDWSDALNPRRSALNPYWNVQQREPRRFAYGSFPLYLLRLSASTVSAVAVAIDPKAEWRSANDYDHLNRVGRALSALFDTLSIALIFLLGRRIFNAKVGLLAAAFLTFAVQHLQLAHFYAFDGVTTTVILAAVYFGVRVVQEGKLSDSVWLGAMVALAVASKFSALPLLLVIFLAHALRPLMSLNAARTIRPAGALGAIANPPLTIHRELSLELNRAVLGMLLSLLIALLAFALVSPFTFLDFNGYLSSINEQSEMVRGILDYPYTRQYRNTGLLYWLDNFVFWAVGPALGLAALAGLLLVLWRAVRRTASAAELLVLAWVVPYGAITLGFQVKFLRYLEPLTPFLCLMAAYALWRVASRDGRFGQLPALVRYAPMAAALVGTLLYAIAFMQIYTQPLTRVSASEWIYRNIPAGSALTKEVWDDSLPFSRIIDGRGRSEGEYRMVEMNLHEPDDARKLANLRQWLRTADYVVISSNRMYGWLPRLAERFPITKRYYDLLFAEQLGFTLRAQFTSFPRLGPLEFDDTRADESFTVYDHPKVLIYQKVRELNDAEFNALFADTPPAQNPSAPTASITRDKSLLLDRPVDQLPAVNDRAWNSAANTSQWIAVAWWWLVVTLLGVLALPLSLALFARFADRGYILAKSLGLLLVAYIMWILASLRIVMHQALSAWAIVLVLLALTAWQLLARRAQFAQFWREHKRIVLFEEALFALAFLAFVFVRMLNPDLWQPWNGGEKSMEFAFLNAILKSPYFPPYDPYFAGGYINYYYYGIYLVGVLIKLTGIASEVAFNLAIPTLFALTIVNAFSVAFNVQAARGAGRSLRAALVSGVLAALFIAVIGNLDGFVQIVEGLGKASGSDFKSGIIGVDGFVKAAAGLPAVLFEGKSLPPFDYWRSSRVIPYTINEFPLWSFLFADLHPHMIGIPFTVLALALAAHTLMRRETLPAAGTELDGTGELTTPLGDSPLHVRAMGVYAHGAARESAWLRRVLFGFALALTLGAIAAINTWDAPTYLGLAIGVLLLHRYWADGLRFGWLRTAGAMAALGVASIALYWPFFSNYKALYVGLSVSDQHTEFQPFIIMWGFFLFVALSYLGGELMRHARAHTPARYVQLTARHALRLPRLLELQTLLSDPLGLKLATVALFALAALSLALFLMGHAVIALLIWPFSLSAALLTRRPLEPRVAFLNWIAFWAFAILLGVEVVYLQDFLGGGEWKRMNTLFKFYIQVWVLLSLLAAIALPELWARISRREGAWPALWQSALVVLIGASLIFTFTGTAARVNDRFPGARPPIGTLDGMAYMRQATYNWPDERNPIEMQYDLDAIRWLQNNVTGTPVVAEAGIGYYREGGLRVSSYTGLPTLLGMHQSEQRYSDDVGKRDGEVREFFNTRDSARTMDLIRQLRIRYIYVGQLERVTYDAAGLAKFEQMRQAGVLDVVYQNPKVMIYRVVAGV